MFDVYPVPFVSVKVETCLIEQIQRLWGTHVVAKVAVARESDAFHVSSLLLNENDVPTESQPFAVGRANSSGVLFLLSAMP